MWHYLLQTVTFQLFFLLVYDTFLKRETFFNWNRAYLLFTAWLSLVLPFIKIESFKKAVPEQFVVALPEVFLGQTNKTIQLDPVVIQSQSASIIMLFTWQNLFYLGVVITLILFVVKLFKVLVLIKNSPKINNGKLCLVTLLKSTNAFSFFNYVFLGERLSEPEKHTILQHEMVHVKQKHTLDLLFFEVLRIVFWFNPLVYIYQNKMITLHEFIADSQAVKHQNKKDYYQNLLAQVFQTKRISFINPFYKQSLIKKRIVMLQKSKSKQIYLLKYALLIPLVFGMLIYTSTEAQDIKLTSQSSGNQELPDEEIKEKLEKEYDELVKNGADFQAIYKAFFVKSHKYVLSKEEYYRQNIYFEKLLGDKKKDLLKSKIIGRNYKEYLEWKRTDEAKEIWENSTSDGVLKLVVDNMKSLTEAEDKRRKEKIDFIMRDEFFHSLVMTDGEIITTLLINEPSKEMNDLKIYESENIEVPFSVIEKVPLFPGCEDLTTNKEQSDCMSRSISQFVNKNFNTKIADSLQLKGRQRINVIFKIDTKGNIIDIRSRAPHPALEEEAIRVISSLPRMIPGEHQGKKVNVPYSLPIIFQVADVELEKVSETSEDIIADDIEVPFSVVENAPVFPGCENLQTNEERKKCMSEKISEFVAQKFNTDLGNELGLTGRQRISVIFKIDEFGSVTTDDIKARAPHKVLEEEAIRVISELPKMTPGTQKGKTVKVPYSLPIIFEVEETKTND
ncbi:M56 family metallopeptidase [Neotamlana nanhaiensis]|uniref:M56 family metallopeptidase n=1 Tax=Neotamlana nanhaiensis TaxID=1382798 RepID=UPI00069AA1CB|nr:M56 family metallopeptidase [Tamlana nanhaiensis]